MPFESKSQQKFMFARHPKMAKEWAKKTPDIKDLPEKKETSIAPIAGNYGDTSASSSAANGALFKEDLPKKVHVGDVFENKPTKPSTENPMKIVPKKDEGHILEGPKISQVHVGEDDTLMGRLAKRMVARDYIDSLNLGLGTKAQRVAKAPTADMSDLGVPHAMRSYSVPKDKLKEGMEIEKEHTDEPALQAKIAADHIKESEEYYPKLKEMEKTFEKDDK